MQEKNEYNEYRVNLEVFEGPLDLLMHLIRKNDLDIYDIPVAFVLEEYMNYMDTLKELDIDLAGEFLLMAAELAHIKSKTLLPEEFPEEETIEDDPRSDLVRRLLEYQQFKEASQQIDDRLILNRDVFKCQAPPSTIEKQEGPVESDLFQLIEAFSKVLKRAPAEQFHDVVVDRVSVNERIYQIASQIKKGITVMVEDLLLDDSSRYNMLITFLALLEMGKLRMIKIFQMASYGSIHIQGTMDDVSDTDMVNLVDSEISNYDGIKNNEAVEK